MRGWWIFVLTILSHLCTSTRALSTTRVSMPPNKQAKAIVAFEAEEKPFDVTRPSGRLLPGTLHIPTIGGKSSRGGPCVVFMHGTLSDRNHNFVPDLSTKLVKELGVSTYRFDSRFSACEEEPEHRYSFSGYSSDVDDLRCVVKALATEGFDVFCLIGHSRGANDILLFAAEQCANSIYPDAAPQLLDPSKLVLVTAAPRFNMPRMLTTLFSAEKIALIESEGKAPWETQRGDMLVTRGDADVVLKEMDMSATVSKISEEVPMLLLHGTDDELIPAEDAQGYKDARNSIEVVIVEGARHAFRGKKQLKTFLSATTSFIQREYTRIYKK